MNQIRSYPENVNAHMPQWAEEAALHEGELVARTLDGANVVAYAADEVAMQRRLAEIGVDPESVVVGFVDV